MRIEDFEDQGLASWVLTYLDEQTEAIKKRGGKASALMDAVRGRTEEHWYWRRREIELSKLWYSDRHFDPSWFPACHWFEDDPPYRETDARAEAEAARKDGARRWQLKRELLDRRVEDLLRKRITPSEGGIDYPPRMRAEDVARALEQLLDETEHVDWGPSTSVEILP